MFLLHLLSRILATCSQSAAGIERDKSRQVQSTLYVVAVGLVIAVLRHVRSCQRDRYYNVSPLEPAMSERERPTNLSSPAALVSWLLQVSVGVHRAELILTIA